MIYKNIIETEEVLSCHFNSLQGFENTAKSIVGNILLFNPNVRLGMLHHGLSDLWGAPFFEG